MTMSAKTKPHHGLAELDKNPLLCINLDVKSKCRRVLEFVFGAICNGLRFGEKIFKGN